MGYDVPKPGIRIQGSGVGGSRLRMCQVRGKGKCGRFMRVTYSVRSGNLFGGYKQENLETFVC